MVWMTQHLAEIARVEPGRKPLALYARQLALEPSL